MPNRRLAAGFRRTAEALLPEAELHQARANRSVVRLDNTVDPKALATAISFTETLLLLGAVTVGVDRSALLPVLGQRGRLRALYARAKTAPSGGECTVWLTANGADVAAVTLQPGETKRATPVGAAVIVDAGADLQARVSAANGAADITITAVFSPVGS